jgi:hypothetical protein
MAEFLCGRIDGNSMDNPTIFSTEYQLIEEAFPEHKSLMPTSAPCLFGGGRGIELFELSRCALLHLPLLFGYHFCNLIILNLDHNACLFLRVNKILLKKVCSPLHRNAFRWWRPHSTWELNTLRLEWRMQLILFGRNKCDQIIADEVFYQMNQCCAWRMEHAGVRGI